MTTEFWKPQKEQLLTTQTEERNCVCVCVYIYIRDYYTTDRQSSDQPELYIHPDKTVCGYALFTVENTSHSEA